MFYGFRDRPKQVPDGVKVKREPFNKCTPNQKCRGSLPFEVDGKMVWKFVYHDAEPDFGITITKCTAQVNGNTICWFEE